MLFSKDFRDTPKLTQLTSNIQTLPRMTLTNQTIKLVSTNCHINHQQSNKRIKKYVESLWKKVCLEFETSIMNWDFKWFIKCRLTIVEIAGRRSRFFWGDFPQVFVIHPKFQISYQNS
jgi:hypothetical protein